MRKDIFIDSTCLFSQKNLLETISDPREDVVNIYDMAFTNAWPREIISAYSILASEINPSLAPDKFEDHIFNKSKVCQILSQEQDRLWETIEKLKSAGLLNIIKFDDPLGMYSEDEKFITDDALFELWESLKMKVLMSPYDIQRVLNIAPLDIDVIAHAIATNNVYKSQNPKIEDGTMAKLMGVQHVLVGEFKFKSIDFVDPKEVEEFLDNKESFLQKTKSMIHNGHKKIFATIIDAALDFVPFILETKSAFKKYREIKEAISKWEEYRKISILEVRKIKIPKPSVQNLIDNFSVFRMEYKFPKRDV